MVELENDAKLMENKFVRQYLLMTRAYQLGGSHEWAPETPFPRIFALLDEAIRLTIPDFDISDLNSLYSLTEIDIIRLISSAHLFNGNAGQALGIFLRLIELLDTDYIILPDRAETYTSILVTTSKTYRYLNRYEEAYQLADIGLNFCAQNQSIGGIPWLLYQKAIAAYYLHRKGEYRNLMEDTIKLFSYYGEKEMVEFCRERKQQLA